MNAKWKAVCLGSFAMMLVPAIYGGILLGADCVYGTAPNAFANCGGAKGADACPEGCRAGYDSTDYENPAIKREAPGSDYRPTLKPDVPCKTVKSCQENGVFYGYACVNNDCEMSDPEDICRKYGSMSTDYSEATYEDNPGCSEE